MLELQIIERPLRTLKPSPRNARTHSEKQIRQIARSIEEFGFNNPILVDSNLEIIAGHGRSEAARLLQLATVPTVELQHLTDDQKRAYIIADNRLAELAGWDKEILAIELQNLFDCDTEFDLTSTGFEMAEIDLLLGSSGQTSCTADDRAPEAAAGPAVSQIGDCWLIGDHRLVCGDALETQTYEQLMGGQLAEMSFADVPYNVPVQGHVSGLGKANHAEFVMASGEMSEAEFTRFLTSAFRCMRDVSAEGSIHFVCMDWRHLSELLRAGRIAFTEFKNLCVWVKDNGGMGSLYRSQHELVAVFKNGTAPHINNIELGRYGRYRTNVWSYQGMNSFHAGRDDNLAMHPTVKPVGMVADAILDCSTRGGIVLDPFLGSGTTIIAAERAGRRGFGIELDPIYVDVSLRRIKSTLGIEPVCQLTGLTFEQREARAEESPDAQQDLSVEDCHAERS